MHNINLFTAFYYFLFNKVNTIIHVKASNLLNIINSTLIPEKQSQFINQNDWGNNRVTIRTKNKEKIYTCGSKLFVLMNKNKQIYHAELVNINYSDPNYLKAPHKLTSKLKGILLADRGFSNKAVRDRLNNKNDIFNYDNLICRLISPHHVKRKLELTKKERKLYKRRWKVEKLFQKLKYNYSEHKLNLTGKYSNKLKQAKLYSTLISYNLSTI